jgi:hypothetical protein
VDPRYEGQKKESAVWAITAVNKIPTEWPFGSEGITEMDLLKGKFNQKLEASVSSIIEYRNNIDL